MFNKTFWTLSLSCAVVLNASSPCCRPLDSFQKCRDVCQNQMSPGYNSPSRIDVRGSWDLYCHANYIYWMPTEENLDLCFTQSLLPSGEVSAVRITKMDFKYKSGVQAGIGLLAGDDNWDLYAEYTWLSGSHLASELPKKTEVLQPLWGFPSPDSNPILSAKASWHLELNIADFQLARSYYVGTKLTFRPFIGIRAPWINQTYTAMYFRTPTLSKTFEGSSRSWGVGPEIGINTDWLLGSGFRLTGTAEYDSPVTHYQLQSKTRALFEKQSSAYFIRPHSNLALGFGWGDYFCNCNYHFDLLATYGFQIFWNQNMLSSFINDTASPQRVSLPNGDLFIHGATAQLRFDF